MSSLAHPFPDSKQCVQVTSGHQLGPEVMNVSGYSAPSVFPVEAWSLCNYFRGKGEVISHPQSTSAVHGKRTPAWPCKPCAVRAFSEQVSFIPLRAGREQELSLEILFGWWSFNQTWGVPDKTQTDPEKLFLYYLSSVFRQKSGEKEQSLKTIQRKLAVLDDKRKREKENGNGEAESSYLVIKFSFWQEGCLK
ncbi:hypothetical protein EK904_007318 [Melospiza melodia maxima]|nr:hypothetical protein EK904_007318 [Melospiza melodia maxima]